MIRQVKEIKIIRKELVEKSDYRAIYKICSGWNAPTRKCLECSIYYFIKEDKEWRIDHKE